VTRMVPSTTLHLLLKYVSNVLIETLNAIVAGLHLFQRGQRSNRNAAGALFYGMICIVESNSILFAGGAVIGFTKGNPSCALGRTDYFARGNYPAKKNKGY